MASKQTLLTQAYSKVQKTMKKYLNGIFDMNWALEGGKPMVLDQLQGVFNPNLQPCSINSNNCVNIRRKCPEYDQLFPKFYTKGFCSAVCNTVDCKLCKIHPFLIYEDICKKVDGVEGFMDVVVEEPTICSVRLRQWKMSWIASSIIDRHLLLDESNQLMIAASRPPSTFRQAFFESLFQQLHICRHYISVDKFFLDFVHWLFVGPGRSLNSFVKLLPSFGSTFGGSSGDAFFSDQDFDKYRDYLLAKEPGTADEIFCKALCSYLNCTMTLFCCYQVDQSTEIVAYVFNPSVEFPSAKRGDLKLVCIGEQQFRVMSSYNKATANIHASLAVGKKRKVETFHTDKTFWTPDKSRAVPEVLIIPVYMEPVKNNVKFGDNTMEADLNIAPVTSPKKILKPPVVLLPSASPAFASKNQMKPPSASPALATRSQLEPFSALLALASKTEDGESQDDDESGESKDSESQDSDESEDSDHSHDGVKAEVNEYEVFEDVNEHEVFESLDGMKMEEKKDEDEVSL